MSNQTGTNTPRKKNSNQRFEASSKYFTISCYILGVILIALIGARMIINWESTKHFLSAVISVISPYFIGFLLAYMVNPLVNLFYAKLYRGLLKLKSHKLSGILSVLTAYIAVLGGLIVCISYIVPQLINSITELITQLPTFYNQIVDWLNDYVAKNPNINTDSINSLTTDYLPHLQDYVLVQLQKIVPMLYGAGLSIIKFCVNLFIALIVSIYLISDKKMIRDYTKKLTYALFSKEHALSLFAIMNDCNAICKSFFIGKTIDSLIIACLCFILMSIFHLPYAMLISVIVGITNMIPYFGPYIGGIPGVLICFIDKPSYGIIFFAIIILLQSFDGMILGPKILGNSTGLRPIMILFSISCGGAIAGVLGMFLGVPIFGIISYLTEKYINYRLHRKNIKWDSDAKDVVPLTGNATATK